MRRGFWPAVLALSLTIAAAGPAAAQTLTFDDGSTAPSQVQVAPGASGTSRLGPGQVVSLEVDAQGRVVAAATSSQGVSGVVDTVEIRSGGRFVLIIDGRSYWARGTAMLAAGGDPIGPLSRNLGLLTDNRVLALLGADGWIGYVDVL